MTCPNRSERNGTTNHEKEILSPVESDQRDEKGGQRWIRVSSANW